jgi:hypothetical protein
MTMRKIQEPLLGQIAKLRASLLALTVQAVAHATMAA